MKTKLNQKHNYILIKTIIVASLYYASVVWLGQAEILRIDPATGLPVKIAPAQTNGIVIPYGFMKDGAIWPSTNLDITFLAIVNLVKLKDDYAEISREFSYEYGQQRNQTIDELIKIFVNTNATDLSRGTAALYLGEMRASAAAEPLAQNITLNLSKAMANVFIGFPYLGGYEVQRDLVKIGLPAIRPVIRNLAESDDKLTRDLSLQTLCEIEKDKDIVRLRLQKALEKEPDKTKQTRLQTALTALDTVKF